MESFLSSTCLKLLDIDNKQEALQTIITSFHEKFECDILYHRQTDKTLSFIFNLNNNFDLIKYNVEDIKDFDLISSNDKIVNTKFEYKFTTKITIEDSNNKTYIEYLHIFCNNINIQNVMTLAKILKNEELKYLHKNRLSKLLIFENQIFNICNNLGHITYNNENVDDFIKNILQIITVSFDMTCGYIMESNKDSYVPTITCMSNEKNKCHYGLYDYKKDTGPWKILKSVLKDNKSAYVYKVDESYKKYFKYGNFPKSMFVAHFNHKSSCDILFALSNNETNVKLDSADIYKLEILFNTIYYIIYKRNKFKVNKLFEEELSNKLIMWKEENKEINIQNQKIRKELSKITKNNIS